jgi:hypothetical protein
MDSIAIHPTTVIYLALLRAFFFEVKRRLDYDWLIHLALDFTSRVIGIRFDYGFILDLDCLESILLRIHLNRFIRQGVLWLKVKGFHLTGGA